MEKLFKSESSRLIAFAVVVLLSRVPFLFSGYGLDADSWEVAITAKHISQSGIYEVSRFPGNPVHEFVSSLFYNGNCFSLNLLTAIVSTIGLLFFVLTLKALRFKKPFLAGFALAAVPVIYIHSATAIDYTWALAFILIAFYFVIREKFILAGLFLGIAIGCRITSGAMLLPFAIQSVQLGGTMKNGIRIFKLAFTTCLVGGLMFLPVYLKYGTEFFTYFHVPYPSIPRVLYKMSFGVWGVVGFVGLVISIILLLLPSKSTSQKYLFPRAVNEKHIIAWLVAIDLYIIAFLKLPMESGYLVPMVPFVILIFGKYLYDKAFTFFAVMLILSPFFFGIAPEGNLDSPSTSPAAFHFHSSDEVLVADPFIGPVFSNLSQRKNAMKFTNHFLASLDSIHRKTLFIAGRWYTEIAVSQPDSASDLIAFVDFIGEENFLKYMDQGFRIYYLPKQDYSNFLKYNFDVKNRGALPYYPE